MHKAKDQKYRHYMQLDKSKKRGMVQYYAMKYNNDPRTIAARRQMEHKAYGGMKG